MKPRLRALPPLLLLLSSLLATACSQDGGTSQPAPKKAPPATHLVAAGEVSHAPLPYASTRTGTLRTRRQVRLFNQEEGRIIELPFYEGDRVEQGAVLARLDDALLRAELERAVATRTQAEQDLKRLRRLVERQMVSEDEVSRAATAVEVARAEEALLRTRLGYMVIRAPFAGVVSARLVEPGDAVPRHTHLLTLIDPGSLVTEVSVSELLLPHLALGQKVRVLIDALGREAHAGHISRIYPQVDASTRLGTVEITIEPVPPGARAGQLARVTLEIPALTTLSIPLTALQQDRGSEYVFRLDDDNVAHRAEVRTGTRLGARVSILEGLDAGARVVTKGFLGLKDGMSVEPVGETP